MYKFRSLNICPLRWVGSDYAFVIDARLPGVGTHWYINNTDYIIHYKKPQNFAPQKQLHSYEVSKALSTRLYNERLTWTVSQAWGSQEYLLSRTKSASFSHFLPPLSIRLLHVKTKCKVPSFASMHEHAQTEIWNSWVSRDVINFTGGQLQIDTLSSDWKKFSLYVLTLCLATNACNFVRFACSSAVQSSIHFGLTPTQKYWKRFQWNPGTDGFELINQSPFKKCNFIRIFHTPAQHNKYQYSWDWPRPDSLHIMDKESQE